MLSQIERGLTWAGERIRDLRRGYSDREYLEHFAIASGQRQITPTDRESYFSRRLRAYGLNGIILPSSTIFTIDINSPTIGAVGAMEQELTRLGQLTQEQLDEEVINNAVRWFEERRLQLSAIVTNPT